MKTKEGQKPFKLYGITGVYFQEGFIYNPEDFDGYKLDYIEHVANRALFNGFFIMEEGQTTNGKGGMFDRLGTSELSDIRLSEIEFSFVKQYKSRADKIRYVFKKKDNLWIGKFSGIATGGGGSRCAIAEIPEELFIDPDSQP